MRKASSLQIALATVVCLCAIPICAQIQSPPPEIRDTASTTEHFNAVVVSAADGKPVARVLVTSPDRRMAAITDAEGRFSFDVRRAAPARDEAHVFSSFPPSLVPTISSGTNFPLQFTVRKPNYITNTVMIRIPAASSAASETPLQLKIVPAAVLTGHLYPDVGDLPANVYVQLRGKMVFNGTATWTQFHAAQVNSRGEFRFGDLPSGDYKLFAPALIRNNLPGTPPESIPGYRAAFYPNANSFEAATPIHLGSAETATANLSVRRADFYSVTIPVANAPATGFNVSLLADLPGLNLSHDGQAARGFLPSGDYDVLLTSATTNAAPATSVASVHLQVASKAVRTEPAAFHPTFEIPILVQRDLTHPATDSRQTFGPAVYAGIQPLTVGGLQPGVQSKPGAITIENLSEGLFHIDIIVNPANGVYVASATSGTTDLLREPFQVLPGSVPRPIEVTLRDDFATLNLRVPQDATQPPASSDSPIFILCIQLDHPQAQPFPFAVQQDQFPKAELPPGRYLVLASHQQLMSIEFRNPDVLRDLTPKGASITLSPNQKADLDVPLMPDGAN